ncbi:MAG: hypothetical protein JNM40_20085 [Myxococcales bacterium]|nr:hypothetical protein [Myxococcales bacterium]
MRPTLSVLGIALLVVGGAMILLRRFGVIHTFPMAGSATMMTGYLLYRIAHTKARP